jgi:hypothetical protein
MLCCALIALFTGQPAVLWAAVRAQLFFEGAAPTKMAASAGTLGATVVLVAEIMLLSGAFFGAAEFRHSSAKPSLSPFHSRICTALHIARTK